MCAFNSMKFGNTLLIDLQTFMDVLFLDIT